MRRLRLIGVQSAGAHAPGLERGPAHLRAAGLSRALAAAGVDAWDWGDLPVSPFATAPAASGARNLPAVLEVVSRVADAVAAARADGEVPVLLGGDCTLVLGAVAGLRRDERAGRGVGLFYLDGDADLDTPQEGWGVLDSCGVAHLLGDGDPRLAALRPDGPLLDAGSLVLFGFTRLSCPPASGADTPAGECSASRSPACPAGRPAAALPRPWPACRTRKRWCATWTWTSSTTRASRWPTAPGTTAACRCPMPSTRCRP